MIILSSVCNDILSGFCSGAAKVSFKIVKRSLLGCICSFALLTAKSSSS